MTDIQTVLLSQLNRSLVGSEMARDIDEVLIERFRAAKQAYRSLPQSQVGGKVEQQRQQLLNRIAMLQSETFFKVSSDTALTGPVARWRDEPHSEPTMAATTAAYRPYWGGSSAIEA